MLDPAHMLKLIRNTLGNKNTLYDHNDEEIKWKHIENLIELQIAEGINLGNKLSKTHAEYKNMIMKVKIAAQTISNSTADSIQYMDEVMKNEKFKNSRATTNYLRVMNNLFDIMNSKLGHCKKEFKQPFTKETVNKFATYFEVCKNYIKGLKVEENGIKKPILQSKSFTGYFGFLHNMTSFLGIYQDHIEECNEFYTFNVSQDHVENFFGCVRRMNGCNDNPSIQQFTAAYRKLLFQNEVSVSSYANCRSDLTSALTVSSRPKCTLAPVDRSELEMLANYDFEHPSDLEEYTNNDSNDIQNNKRAYFGSIVERKVIRKIVQKGSKMCPRCINVFTENEITDDQFIAFKSINGDILQPCKSTVSIIHKIDYFLDKYKSLQISFNSMTEHILKNIDFAQFFMASDFGEEHDHQEDLIESVIKTYLDEKSKNAAKVVTRLEQNQLIRHDYLKAIHNQGQ